MKRCIQHARQSTRFKTSLQLPALYLVHSDGVFLTSNGDPADDFSAYAFNCDPHRDINCEINSKLLVGNNEFAQVIPIKPTWLNDCDSHKLFNLRVTDTAISDRFTHPIKIKKKHGKSKRIVKG